jgi:hypothetical protein
VIQRKRPAALPEIIRAAMPEARCWELKIDGETYRAIVNRENIAAERDVPDERWHVSVSNETHLPPWAVFAEVIHELRPGVPFCLPIPPKSWWVNVHEFVLHAHEVKDENLVSQWRFESRGERPT